MNNTDRKPMLSTAVVASLAVACTLITLAFLSVSVLLLRQAQSSGHGFGAEVSAAENPGSQPSIFADPNAVQTRLHTELGQYLDTMGEDRFNLSVAVETADQSVTYFFNCDKEQEAASLYKLPLAMLFCDQIAQGKLDPNAPIDFSSSAVREEGWNPIGLRYAPGSQVPVREAIESMLTHSDNTAAAILYEDLGGWEAFARLQMAYSSRAAVPENDLDNVVNASQVMDELRIVQSDPARYALIIEALDEAQDDAYLNEFVADDSMIQKYGQIDANTNAAGFSKSGVPYRIVMLSQSAQCQIDPGQINEIVWTVLNTSPLATPNTEASSQAASAVSTGV